MAASINNKRTSRNVGYAGSAWDATRVHCQVLDEKLSKRKARGGKKSAAIELHRRRLAFEIIREPSQFSIARASPCPLFKLAFDRPGGRHASGQTRRPDVIEDRESLLPSCLRRCTRLDLYSLDALRVCGRLLDV